MSTLDKDYCNLLQDILDNGVEKKDRTGTGTISVFGRQIRHKMSDGFPLLTTKKMHWKSIVTELLWFLRGETNIKYLVDNGCNIWDGDAYKNYTKYPLATIHDHHTNILYQNRDKGWCMLNGRSMVSPHPTRHLTKEEFINKIKTDDEFAKKWGNLGPIYGKQWRSWDIYENGITLYPKGPMSEPQKTKYIRRIDQIANLINDLKTNPDSRRLMVNAWNVGELDQMVLPPCHYGFQVYTRELSLEERVSLFSKNVNGEHLMKYADSDGLDVWDAILNKHNIPTRAISLMWNQRSVDTFLGLPFNIASYGLLLHIIAKSVNMVPDELIGNLGDTHLYSNHIEQAKEQIGRELSLDERIELASSDIHFDPGDFGIGLTITEEHCHKVCDEYGVPRRTRQPFTLPQLNINTEFWPYEGGSCGEGPLDAIAVFEAFKDNNFCKCLLEQDIQLGNYQSHPSIKAPLSN